MGYPKIGIDLRPIQSHSKTRGIGYYTSALTSAILRKNPNFKFIFYTRLTSSPPKNFKLLKKDTFVKVPTVIKPLKLVRRFDPLMRVVWDYTLKRHKPSLIHLTSLFEVYYLSIPNNIKTVITIYDLIPLLFRKKYFADRNAEQWYLNRLRQVSRVSKVITISASVKKDLMKFLNISGEKIKVIYGGFDKRFLSINKESVKARLYKKYRINKPYILSVGGHTINKNMSRVFKAFQIYLRQFDKDEIFLVVVCKMIRKEERFWKKELNSLGITNRVILTNFVPDEDMPYFYNGAKLLLFPSLYEGFGLPVVEAMACGTPVVTSNVSSIPEVGGDAVYYVNPLKNSEIVFGINKIINYKGLGEKMIKLGIKQSKIFSWHKAATETLKVYQEVLESF